MNNNKKKKKNRFVVNVFPKLKICYSNKNASLTLELRTISGKKSVQRNTRNELQKTSANSPQATCSHISEECFWNVLAGQEEKKAPLVSSTTGHISAIFNILYHETNCLHFWKINLNKNCHRSCCFYLIPTFFAIWGCKYRQKLSNILRWFIRSNGWFGFSYQVKVQFNSINYWLMPKLRTCKRIQQTADWSRQTEDNKHNNLHGKKK